MAVLLGSEPQQGQALRTQLLDSGTATKHGVVHNALMFGRPEKTVVRGPFRRFPASFAGGETTILPRPPWFVTNKTANVTSQRLTDLTADGKWRHIPGIFVPALRGCALVRLTPGRPGPSSRT
jgi:hypothetical protein